MYIGYFVLQISCKSTQVVWDWEISFLSVATCAAQNMEKEVDLVNI